MTLLLLFLMQKTQGGHTKGTLRAQRGHKGGSDDPEKVAFTTPNAAPEKRREEKREEKGEDTQGAVAPAVPVWARNVKGARPAQAVEGVAAIVSAVRGQPTKPAKTTAAPVLALYRATELPWSDFVRDAVLVAEAAHQCPDRLFARDIRAEDWPDGTDRQRDVATVCRHDRWQVRLDAARAWDAAGRPTAGVGSLLAGGKPDLKNLHRTMETFDLEAYRREHTHPDEQPF